MDDSPNFAFGKLVPGFDFLQNLVGSATKGASQTMPQLPSLGNWVAPTLNVEDIDKRIGELKAVQFWLDQNATALKATIQALEVQKMTLATLKGMNFDVAQMAEAFKLKAPASLGASQMPQAPETAQALKAKPRRAAATKPGGANGGAASGAAGAGGVIDPMQWWGALTQQFQGIAAGALKDAAQRAAADAVKGAVMEPAKDATTKGARAPKAKRG